MNFSARQTNSPVYYKFPVPENMDNLLKNYRGRFEKLWIPKTRVEHWCYVLLKEEDFDRFVSHFGENGKLVDHRAWELPDSIFSTSMHAQRVHDFRLVSLQKESR
jgi:hypothetical protein